MIKEGTEVEWKWGSGRAHGSVTKIYKKDAEVTIDGNKVKREASEDEPAYLIEQSDGQKVLKSKSEVSRRSS